MAAVKTGHVLFLPSPRNSAEAFDSLLTESRAVAFLSTPSIPPTIFKVLEARKELTQIPVPDLDTLLDSTPVEVIEYSKSWESSRFDPLVRVHTSGSTGIPKLVTLRHGSFSAIDAMQLLDTNDLARRLGGGLRVLCAFPPFHVAGLTYTLAAPCWVDCTVILPPPGPLTAEVVDKAHRIGAAEHSLLPPSLLVELVKNTDYRQHLSKLSGVMFAGGPLPHDTGDLVSTHTNLMSSIGTTEANMIPQLPKEPEDWPYFRFNTTGGGLEFRPRGEDLFELVIVRRPELDLSQPVFITFPDLHEFETKDLYERHPSKLDLWKYKSRLDDIIVLSNGEKINPVTMESQISTCPIVNGCLVVGQGRFQAAVIIEIKPENTEKDRLALINRIWPFVQQANTATVRHGRIAKEFMLFTDPEKPFVRAGKGTIQRASSTRLYEKEVETWYTNLSSGQESIPVGTTTIELTSPQDTAKSLRNFLKDELQVDSISDDQDFFALGIDSLQLMNLVRAINRARIDRPIDLKQVYNYPSVHDLVQSLHSSRSYYEGHSNPYDSDDEEVQADWLAMGDKFDQLTSDWKPDKGGSWTLSRDAIRSSNEGPIIQPDRGPLAWMQVFASFLLNINNWGLINTFGAFQAYYESDLLKAHSPSAISWIGTIQGSSILLVGVISGPLFDTGYFKFTATMAGIGLTSALILLSFSTLYWHIILSQGILLGLCSGLLFIPSIALIPIYFKDNRGLALGLATGGGSIGGIIYPIAFRRLLQSIGFSWSVRVIALLAFTTIGIAVLVMKPLGPRTRRQFINVQAFKEPAYIFFMISSLLTFAALLVPFILSTTFATTILRLDSNIAFYLLPCLNGSQFVGRLVAGYSSDFHHRYLGPEILLFLAELCAGVLGFGWLGVSSLAGYIVWLLLYGFTTGVASVLPPTVLPHICPNLAVFGTRLGVLYACAGVGYLISAPVATAANDSTGGFVGAQIWTGICCVVASTCFGVTAYHARTRRLLYESGKRPKRFWRKQKVRHIFSNESQSSEKNAVD